METGRAYRYFLFGFTNILSAFGLFWMLDITPPVFSDLENPRSLSYYAMNPQSNLDPGIYVGDAVDGILSDPIAIVVIVSAFALISTLEIYLWDKLGYRPFILTATSILNIFCFIILVIFIPTVNTYNGTISVPLTLVLAVILQTILIGTLSAVASGKLIPNNFDGMSNREAVLYIDTQWRYARVFIAPTIAFVVGISFPITSYLSASPPVFRGLLAIWGAFALPLFSIAAYFIMRMRACTNEFTEKDRVFQPPII
jgi:hypothetical protein